MTNRPDFILALAKYHHLRRSARDGKYYVHAFIAGRWSLVARDETLAGVMRKTQERAPENFDSFVACLHRRMAGNNSVMDVISAPEFPTGEWP